MDTLDAIRYAYGMSKKYEIDGMKFYTHIDFGYTQRRFDWELVLATSAFVFIIISAILIFGVFGDLPELINSI